MGYEGTDQESAFGVWSVFFFSYLFILVNKKFLHLSASHFTLTDFLTLFIIFFFSAILILFSATTIYWARSQYLNCYSSLKERVLFLESFTTHEWGISTFLDTMTTYVVLANPLGNYLK